MKYVCKFTLKKEAIKKAIEVAANDEVMQESFARSIKNHYLFQNFDEQIKGAILLCSSAFGLLKLGLTKEQATSLLENIFILEISEKDLSPGNDKIH